MLLRTEGSSSEERDAAAFVSRGVTWFSMPAFLGRAESTFYRRADATPNELAGHAGRGRYRCPVPPAGYVVVVADYRLWWTLVSTLGDLAPWWTSSSQFR